MKWWINPIGVHCSNNDMTLYSYCPNSNIDVPSQFLSSAWASVIHWEKYSLTWQNDNGEPIAGICWNILMAMFWDPQDIEKSHAMLHKNNQKHVEQWNIYMILTTIMVLCNLTEVHTCSSGSIRVQKKNKHGSPSLKSSSIWCEMEARRFSVQFASGSLVANVSVPTASRSIVPLTAALRVRFRTICILEHQSWIVQTTSCCNMDVILEQKLLIWTAFATCWFLDLLLARNLQHLEASKCAILFAWCLP